VRAYDDRLKQIAHVVSAARDVFTKLEGWAGVQDLRGWSCNIGVARLGASFHGRQ
jgi:hypothetical protein